MERPRIAITRCAMVRRNATTRVRVCHGGATLSNPRVIRLCYNN